jgi:hypothetical protein
MAIADYPRYSLLASVLDASPDDALCALGALPDVVAARRFAERQSVRSGSAGLSGEAALVRLAVSAVVKMPVASELWAARSPLQVGFDRSPRRLAVALHVVRGDLIGDALVAPRSANRTARPYRDRGRPQPHPVL